MKPVPKIYDCPGTQLQQMWVQRWACLLWGLEGDPQQKLQSALSSGNLTIFTADVML